MCAPRLAVILLRPTPREVAVLTWPRLAAEAAAFGKTVRAAGTSILNSWLLIDETTLYCRKLA